MDKRQRNATSWEIREVPQETRRKIKAWAEGKGITLAEALTLLIDNQLKREFEDEYHKPQ